MHFWRNVMNSRELLYLFLKGKLERLKPLNLYTVMVLVIFFQLWPIRVYFHTTSYSTLLKLCLDFHSKQWKHKTIKKNLPSYIIVNINVSEKRREKKMSEIGHLTFHQSFRVQSFTTLLKADLCQGINCGFLYLAVALMQ